MRMFVGGCAYRSSVHVRHATSMAELATRGIDLEFNYRHTSNLPQGRCLWLRAAIHSKCDFALSVDSDNSFSSERIVDEISEVLEYDSAIVVAPVVRDTSFGKRLNLWSAPGIALRPSDCNRLLPGPTLWAGGFGVVLFNLAWFRLHWPAPFPEQFGDAADYINQGEDTQLCRSVASRGGRIAAMLIETAHHWSAGEGFDALRYDDVGRMKVCSE